MVWADRDPLTGAMRDALFLSDADANALGLGEGDPVLVRSPHGEMRRACAPCRDPTGQRAGVLSRGQSLALADRPRTGVGRARLQRDRRTGSRPLTPEALLECFDDVARVREVVAPIDARTRRARTDVPGQYALDVIADAAALEVLRKAPVRIVSEESGVHEHAGATVTVVLDPVDGSTNCSRGISYWAISLCALDADGALAALVVNQATGERTTAIRGGGARRDGVVLRASTVTAVEKAVVARCRVIPTNGCRGGSSARSGCASLMLCDVAAGGLDGLIDNVPNLAPWDYLGGYLACVEAGAIVRDANGEELVTDDPDPRRQLIAAGTPQLADVLMPEVLRVSLDLDALLASAAGDRRALAAARIAGAARAHDPFHSAAHREGHRESAGAGARSRRDPRQSRGRDPGRRQGSGARGFHRHGEGQSISARRVCGRGSTRSTRRGRSMTSPRLFRRSATSSM